LFSGTGITLVSPDEAHVCICSGLVNDEREEPEDYRQTLKALAQRQVPMVCANPDRMIERAGRFISCAGALADMYEEMGGKVTWFGKPYQPIYDAALTRLIQFTEKPIDPSRVLAIGDSVTTDIAGAVNAGLDSLLILGGIHRPKCSVNGQISIDHARLWLTTQSVKPRYLMASLV
jgi:HAD superfamily hydrolase (TIGR01459 family)